MNLRGAPSFVRTLLLHEFLEDFMPIYPLYALLFVAHGVTTGQVSVLLIAWSLSSIVFEIPAGVIADKYDRRHVLVVGQVLRLVGYGMWIVAPSFWGFLVGFLFWAAQGALRSGTFEALVYDELAAHEQSTLLTKVFGWTSAASLFGILSSSL